jgi:hypothetical protein
MLGYLRAEKGGGNKASGQQGIEEVDFFRFRLFWTMLIEMDTELS